MSDAVTTDKPDISQIEEHLMHCPNCGYEIPKNITLCWKCGAFQESYMNIKPRKKDVKSEPVEEETDEMYVLQI